MSRVTWISTHKTEMPYGAGHSRSVELRGAPYGVMQSFVVYGAPSDTPRGNPGP